MFCPECVSISLNDQKLQSADLELDYCPGCGGIWFDQAELERALPHAILNLAVPGDAPETGRGCPRCDRARLFRVQYPQTDVQVDVCRKCRGVWLDAGEAEAINRARKELGDAALKVDPNKDGTATSRFFGRIYDFMCKYGG
ncbi:MAG: zf-TFIIB domain-containing protein [Phycisphaerae bacterium]